MFARIKLILPVLSLLLIVILLVSAEPALAGPGGKIARSLFDSFWGKLLLVALTIIFLPLIVIGLFKERRAERRARKDLRYMAKYGSNFEWLVLKQRITDCFHRIHQAWEHEDLEQVTDWMTSWYWQNQQSVFLDEWAKRGLVNICKVKSINTIKPLLFVHRDPDKSHEGSMLVVSVSARMQDYLMKRESKDIVEGSKKYKEVEKIWTFILENETWKVSNIEESDAISDYLNMVSELPKIEETLSSTQVK